MLGTIVAILFAVYLVLSPYVTGENLRTQVIESTMIAVAIPLLFLLPISMFFCWQPLQQAESKATPRIIDLFKKDKRLAIIGVWTIIFALITLLYGVGAFHHIPQQWLFAAWLIGLGITLDAMRHLVLRIADYFNPYSAVEMFTKEAKQSVRDENEQGLCNWIDALSEVSLKAIQRHSTALANNALDELNDVGRLFLEANKSIGLVTDDKQTKAMGIADKFSYTMFYLYQRLDIAFNNALEKNMEPTCSKIITIMGKLAVSAAKFDMSLASAPLRFLGKFAKKAQEKGLEESTITASCVFIEVSREILTEVDITYYEIKDPFLSIINGMEVLAKGEFKKDKNISIPLLMAPFQELKALFEQGKAKDHQDTPVILQNINRVLGEFEALQTVMSTLPPLPKPEV